MSDERNIELLNRIVRAIRDELENQELKHRFHNCPALVEFPALDALLAELDADRKEHVR